MCSRWSFKSLQKHIFSCESCIWLKCFVSLWVATGDTAISYLTSYSHFLSFSHLLLLYLPKGLWGLEEIPFPSLFYFFFSTLFMSVLITLGLLTQLKSKQKFSQDDDVFRCTGPRYTSHTILPFARLTSFSLVMSCRPCLRPSVRTSAGRISPIAKWRISTVKLSSCCCSVIGHRSTQGLHFACGVDLSCGC